MKMDFDILEDYLKLAIDACERTAKEKGFSEEKKQEIINQQLEKIYEKVAVNTRSFFEEKKIKDLFIKQSPEFAGVIEAKEEKERQERLKQENEVVKISSSSSSCSGPGKHVGDYRGANC